MLTENDVISAVVKFLKNKCYVIEQECNTSQNGVDIIAIKNCLEIYIEAKGLTSSRISSSRHGKPFNSSQIKTHIAKAFYTAVQLKEKYKKFSGIALPCEKYHKELISQIALTLNHLKIEVFWVCDNKTVCVENFSGLFK